MISSYNKIKQPLGVKGDVATEGDDGLTLLRDLDDDARTTQKETLLTHWCWFETVAD